MSCVNRNRLLPFRSTDSRSTENILAVVFSTAVYVPVFCACMLAAGGIRIPPQRLVLAQRENDRETEFIISDLSVPDY